MSDEWWESTDEWVKFTWMKNNIKWKKIMYQAYHNYKEY